EAQQRGVPVHVVRNGSRGLLWLEPPIEVLTAAGRVAYGPVTPQDVAEMFDAGCFGRAAAASATDAGVGTDSSTANSPPHRLHLGLTDQIPYLKRQQRLTFARVGIIDPLSLDDYQRYGGWQGARKAL